MPWILSASQSAAYVEMAALLAVVSALDVGQYLVSSSTYRRDGLARHAASILARNLDP